MLKGEACGGKPEGAGGGACVGKGFTAKSSDEPSKPHRQTLTHQAELSELLDRAPQPALTLIQPFDPVDRSVPAASAAVHN